MAKEVCLFDKFSYCKNGDKCLRIHLKEVCFIRECDHSRCDKRHPKPCKIFRIRGFCKFGTSCRYSHRLPKEVEEQNKRIDSLEEITVKLSKQVAVQNNEIKELKIKLIESESRTITRLQQQIDALVESNDKKEEAIKNLQLGVEESYEKESAQSIMDEQEQTYVTEETVVGDDRCEAEEIKNYTINYAQKVLVHIEETEAEINKIRKNAKDFKTSVESKFKLLDDKLEKIEVNEELCEDMCEQICRLRENILYPVRSKEISLIKLEVTKNYLRDYLDKPKRPSQIKLNKCCKKCLLMNNPFSWI